MNILIIDDQSSGRMFLADILAPYGIITTAADGQKGVDLFNEALAANDPFDLVLLDLLMPTMGGEEALKRMRAAEKESNLLRIPLTSQKTARIIIQTNNDDPVHILQPSSKWKCNGFLIKPITKEKLLEKMVHLELIKR